MTSITSKLTSNNRRKAAEIINENPLVSSYGGYLLETPFSRTLKYDILCVLLYDKTGRAKLLKLVELKDFARTKWDRYTGYDKIASAIFLTLEECGSVDVEKVKAKLPRELADDVADMKASYLNLIEKHAKKINKLHRRICLPEEVLDNCDEDEIRELAKKALEAHPEYYPTFLDELLVRVTEAKQEYARKVEEAIKAAELNKADTLAKELQQLETADEELIAKVREIAKDRDDWRANDQSPDWIGYPLAKALGFKVDKRGRLDKEGKHAVESLIETMIKQGVLVQYETRHPVNRRAIKCLKLA